MSAFLNKPIDRRNLSAKDRADYNKGGEYGSQLSAYKRARAYNAQNKMLANRDQKTTTQTPGTGGFTQGLGIQQERYRQMGNERDAAESNRPKVYSTMYDIYKPDV